MESRSALLACALVLGSCGSLSSGAGVQDVAVVPGRGEARVERSVGRLDLEPVEGAAARSGVGGAAAAGPVLVPWSFEGAHRPPSEVVAHVHYRTHALEEDAPRPGEADHASFLLDEGVELRIGTGSRLEERHEDVIGEEPPGLLDLFLHLSCLIGVAEGTLLVGTLGVPRVFGSEVHESLEDPTETVATLGIHVSF